MIYTCTITPSVDYTTYLTEFNTGKLNRSADVHYYPGGKGINVSRVLKRLGVDSVALGYAGGFTGQYIEQFLHGEGIQTDFIRTDEITRINVKIKAAEETELNGPGPAIEMEQLAELEAKVQNLETGDWFVLAGSLPDSIPMQFLSDLARMCAQKNIHFVLDTSGAALKKLIPARPFLIKPNLEELGELFGTEIDGKEAAYGYARKLVDQGVQHVIVSMGGEGALLVTGEAAVFATAPEIQVVNTVGAGDSLVSGFIASFNKDEDPFAAFQYGVASGSATAFRSDLCEKKDVETLLDQVTLHPFHKEDVTK